MWDCLRPAYMEIVIEAALDTAIRKMDDEEDLKRPSNAIKIKHDIIKMAKTKRSLAVRNLDKDRADVGWQNAKDEAEEFIQDVQDSWTENVSRLAYSLLSERRLNCVNHLPKPEDVQKLSMHLVDSLKAADLSREAVTWIQ